LSDLRAWLKAHVEQKAVLSGNKNSDWPNCEFLRTVSSSFNEKEKHPAQIKLHCILTSQCSQPSVLGLWKHIHWQCQDLSVILNKRRDACFECIAKIGGNWYLQTLNCAAGMGGCPKEHLHNMKGWEYWVYTILGVNSAV
jgi:hypothetical protein